MPRKQFKTTNRPPKVQIQKHLTDWIIGQEPDTQFTVQSVHAAIPELSTCKHDSVRKACRTLCGLLCKEIKPGSADGRTPAIYATLTDSEIEDGLGELAYRKSKITHYKRQGYEPGIPQINQQPEIWSVTRIWALEGQINRAQSQSKCKPLSSECWVRNVVWAILAARKYSRPQVSIGGSLGSGCRVAVATSKVG